MSILLHAARLSLPILFFGYAVIANVVLVSGSMPTVRPDRETLLSGGLTVDIDRAYKKALPHAGSAYGLIGAARYALIGEGRPGVIVGHDGWLFTSEEARPMPAAHELAAVVAVIKITEALLEAQGTELVVVPVPGKIDVLRGHSAAPEMGGALEGLYGEFLSALAAREIAVVDARKALVTVGEDAFLPTDTHWSPLGAAAVAHAVASSGAIQQGGRTYRSDPAPAALHPGDLVGFVTSPAFARAIDLPPEVVPQARLVETGGVDDIFGNADADIVLVGTSYSANPLWGFSDALSRNLGRDVVNFAEPGRGPSAPMQDFLAGDVFRTSPPAVVIWEIPVRYLTDPGIWQALPDARAHGLPSLVAENTDG